MLIVLEGPDSIGKTSLAKTLRNELGDDALYFAFPGAQEGTLGKLVYDLHHNPEDHNVKRLSTECLQLLHIAAHVDAIWHDIVPALRNGKTVVMDRFWWSTYVYGLYYGIDKTYMDVMLAVEHYAWADIVPDVLFLIDTVGPIEPEKITNKLVWYGLKDGYKNLFECKKSGSVSTNFVDLFNLGVTKYECVENVHGDFYSALDTMLGVIQDIEEQ